MNVERRTLAGLKWGATAKVLTQAVSWCVTFAVIRLLAPGDYGLMALSAVIMATFAGVAELGLGASLIQARNPTPADLARVSGALLLLNGSCALIVCLAAPLFADLFGHERLELVVQVSALQFILSALSAVPESIAYREMRFKWLAAADITSGFVTSATTLTLALLSVGVWALVIGNLAGLAVRTAMLMYGSPFVRPQLRFRGMGEYLKFGGAWSGARFAWQLTYQTDIVIAGRFLTQEAVGLYSVATQLANLPLQKAMSVINQVAFPAIARLQEELPRMKRNLLDALRLLGFSAVPALWGICAVAPELVRVVLGEQWSGATLPLQAIALVAPLRIVGSILATAISALGRAHLDLINNLVTLAIFPVVLLASVRWGIGGLAIAYAVAVAVTFVMNFPRTARVVGITAAELFTACRGTLLAGVTMLATVTAARMGLATAPDAARLAALIIIGAAAYLGTLWFLDRTIWTEAKRVAAALREQG